MAGVGFISSWLNFSESTDIIYLTVYNTTWIQDVHVQIWDSAILQLCFGDRTGRLVACDGEGSRFRWERARASGVVVEAMTGGHDQVLAQKLKTRTPNIQLVELEHQAYHLTPVLTLYFTHHIHQPTLSCTTLLVKTLAFRQWIYHIVVFFEVLPFKSLIALLFVTHFIFEHVQLVRQGYR